MPTEDNKENYTHDEKPGRLHTTGEDIGEAFSFSIGLEPQNTSHAGLEEGGGFAVPEDNENGKASPVANTGLAVLAPIRPARGVGQLMYMLGFYAEIRILHIFRVFRAIALFIGGMFALLFGGVLRSIGGLFVGLWKDLTEPFRRFFSGLKSIRQVMQEEQERGSGKAGKKAIGYFGSGIKTYGHLLNNFLKFLLPLAAAAVFIFTVYSMLGFQYGISVYVNDTLVGYIAEETAFEDVRNMIRQRIAVAGEFGPQDWQITPQYHISRTSSFTTKTQMADNILLQAQAEGEVVLIEAVGLSIGGELAFVTTEPEELQEFLDEVRDSYKDPARPDATPEFVQEVAFDDLGEGSLYIEESITPIDELKETLNSVVVEEARHVADGEETLSDIAHSNNLSLSRLLDYNPNYTVYFSDTDEDEKEEATPDETSAEEDGEEAIPNDDDLLYEGELVPPMGASFIVQPEQKYLRVSLNYIAWFDEVLEYETIYEESTRWYVGTNRVAQEGEDGYQRAPYQIQILDGVRTQLPAEGLEAEILSPSTPEIIEVGIAVQNSDPGHKDAYAWPVPGATGQSRGYSGYHFGLDINAPEWTEVVASNAGVVTVAEYHPSYGNYVIIEHQDGNSTLYAHNVELIVEVGQIVGYQEVIAYVGTTGNSTGYHCHFEFYANGVRTDPAFYVAAPWA